MDTLVYKDQNLYRKGKQKVCGHKKENLTILISSELLNRKLEVKSLA